MNQPFLTFEPASVALLGFGEAGSVLAGGLCAADGWLAAAPGTRELQVIDTALGQGERGRAMLARLASLGLTGQATYTEALARADLVISVVTGEDALPAARMARPWLRPGCLYADFNSITGDHTRAVAAELAPAGIDFVDVAVMGSFLANGARVPLLLSGPRAPDLLNFATAIGTPARVLGEQIGAASSVKILRTIMMKGIEALAVECLVAARRQGLVDEVLDNVSDVDQVGFANWLRVLTVSHLTHARRRMEEVDKAIDNLEQTGITPIMSPATRRSHLRTVQAGLASGETSGIDLDTALRLLDERVIGRGRP